MNKTDADEELIANIASSYAARADVGADDIVELVAKLRREFGAATAETPAPTRLDRSAEPAVPIDQAVTRDKVYCLCCGKGFKMLKRHLGAEHGMSEQEYRTLFGLPETMPLVAPSYSRKKADYAKETGFGKYERHAARKESNSDQTA